MINSILLIVVTIKRNPLSTKFLIQPILKSFKLLNP